MQANILTEFIHAPFFHFLQETEVWHQKLINYHLWQKFSVYLSAPPTFSDVQKILGTLSPPIYICDQMRDIVQNENVCFQRPESGKKEIPSVGDLPLSNVEGAFPLC